MGRPKKAVEVIEKVAPHTIKKCELIEAYVDEWARKILGFNGANGRVRYPIRTVDCPPGQ